MGMLDDKQSAMDMGRHICAELSEMRRLLADQETEYELETSAVWGGGQNLTGGTASVDVTLDGPSVGGSWEVTRAAMIGQASQQWAIYTGTPDNATFGEYGIFDANGRYADGVLNGLWIPQGPATVRFFAVATGAFVTARLQYRYRNTDRPIHTRTGESL